jgi:hypothetical protein
VAYRGPYEYSVPGAETDFSPQFEPGKIGDQGAVEEAEAEEKEGAADSVDASKA